MSSKKQPKKSGATSDSPIRDELRIRILDKNRTSHSPAVRNGEKILWINETKRNCRVRFEEDRHPFEGSAFEYAVDPGGTALSERIQHKGNVDETYIYKVEFFPLGEDVDDGDGVGKGDPMIIVKG